MGYDSTNNFMEFLEIESNNQKSNKAVSSLKRGSIAVKVDNELSDKLKEI